VHVAEVLVSILVTFDFYYYYIYIKYNYICSRNMAFKNENRSKTEFHRNGLLATLSSNFQEGQI